jgi:hypothetical protein
MRKTLSNGMNHDLEIVVGVTPQDAINMEAILCAKPVYVEHTRVKKRTSIWITHISKLIF